MTILDDRDVRVVLRILPPALKVVAESVLYGHGLVIAGGVVRAAVTGERVSDVDVFAPDHASALVAAERYLAQFDGRGSSSPSGNAITCKVGRHLPVQFITRWTFPDAYALLGSFDFSVARAAVYFRDGKWEGICDDRFYPDLAARRLVYRNLCWPRAGSAIPGAFSAGDRVASVSLAGAAVANTVSMGALVTGSGFMTGFLLAS